VAPATRGAIGYGMPGRASAIQLDGWTHDEIALASDVGVVTTWPELVTRRYDRATTRFADRPYGEAKKEYDDRVAEIRGWLDAARRYAAAQSARQAARPRPDLRLAALVDVIERRLPILVRADGERQIRDAVALAGEESLRLIVVGGQGAAPVAALLAERKVPVILGPTQRLPREDDEAYDAPYTLARDLRAAGVVIAISTFGASAAATLPYEAGQAVAFGLSWEDGLAAISRAPAEILGLGDRLGTLEPGKIANLIVTGGDPLEIRTPVLHVMIGGRLVDLENKQSRSYQRYRTRGVEHGAAPPKPAATEENER
jgi:imidazolonepropionase-like amidohydrolase